MIIIRRKILALSILALTACGAPQSGASGESDAAPSEAPDESNAAQSAPGASGAESDAPGVAPAAATDPDGRRVALFIGTSLTAGYGVGEEVAWPAIVQRMIDSAGLPYRVTNAGISGETSAGGLRRIDWSLQQPADVLVLELGANDALRGLDTRQLRANLDSIITRARDVYPGIAVVLAGMEAPPNLGAQYTRAFRDVFTGLARRHDAALVPFLLDGVAADASLNIDDGIHPNAAGHRVIARTVWRTLEPVLRERMTRPPASATPVGAAQRDSSDSS
ncbi:MAG TPA: arylesterase [Longimicrobiales bacterium]